MTNYCRSEHIVSRVKDEEGREITKTRYFYGKTKEEALYKYREYLRTSSDKDTATDDLSTENRGDLISACCISV